MGRYAPLDPAVFRDDDRAAALSWINLGLWRAGGGADGAGGEYARACEAYARACGELAALRDGERVVDVGCGCGDSLVLWTRMADVQRVTGVNVTESECELARKKCREEGEKPARLDVVCLDAVAFLELQEPGEADVVISVDALYHVNTRRAFIAALSRSRPKRFVAADILGAFEFRDPASWWSCLLQAPLRFLGISLVSAVSGVPLDNLTYGVQGLSRISARQGGPGKGAPATLTAFQEVTQDVFAPFSSHMRRKALRVLRQGQVSRAVQLMGSALFMGWLGRSGLVGAFIFRIDFDQ